MKHRLHSIYASNCLTCITVGSAAGETRLLLLQAAPLISLMAQAQAQVQAASPSRPLLWPMTHTFARPALSSSACPRHLVHQPTTGFLRNQARRVRTDDSDMLNVRHIHPACAHTHTHDVMLAMTPTRPLPPHSPRRLSCPVLDTFCFVAPHYCRALY